MSRCPREGDAERERDSLVIEKGKWTQGVKTIIATTNKQTRESHA
jgi:hypothetical protein